MLTRIMFIGLWNFADDEGLLRWNPSYVRSCVFPYDDLSLNKIKDAQSELIKEKLIMPYAKDGQSYAWIINFNKHQKINRPQESRLPPPRYDYHVYRDIIYARDKYICKKCGIICNPNNISIDHDKPVFKGGTDHPSNLQVMCIKCNKSKGIKPIHEQFTECSLNVQHEEDEHSVPNVNVNENVNVNVNENVNGKGNKLSPLQFLWNGIIDRLDSGLATVIESSKSRMEKERLRLKERPLKIWGEVFTVINKSKFCCGENNRMWKATYDWIISNETNAIKVLEGRYDDQKPVNNKPKKYPLALRMAASKRADAEGRELKEEDFEREWDLQKTGKAGEFATLLD